VKLQIIEILLYSCYGNGGMVTCSLIISISRRKLLLRSEHLSHTDITSHIFRFFS